MSMRHVDHIEAPEDRALRPLSFSDFLGQDNVKTNLEVFVHGALSRSEPLDHVLLSGPPGLGKTTLANILANEMGSRLVTINAPSIKTKGELASILTGLDRGDILFLDETHGLSNKVEEVLYPAMEDYRLELVAGGRAITIDLEPFTLIGATTRPGMIQRPMRDRFGYIALMQLYSDAELCTIITNSARKLGVNVDDSGAHALAQR
ncbi:MAG: AAA family ATPase, partial [bacterium]